MILRRLRGEKEEKERARRRLSKREGRHNTDAWIITRWDGRGRGGGKKKGKRRLSSTRPAKKGKNAVYVFHSEEGAKGSEEAGEGGEKGKGYAYFVDKRQKKKRMPRFRSSTLHEGAKKKRGKKRGRKGGVARSFTDPVRKERG